MLVHDKNENYCDSNVAHEDVLAVIRNVCVDVVISSHCLVAQGTEGQQGQAGIVGVKGDKVEPITLFQNTQEATWIMSHLLLFCFF